LTECYCAGSRQLVTFPRQILSQLTLVPSERHAEVEAARGARTMTLRELATKLAEASAPSTRLAPLEATRLLTRRVLEGQTAALAVAVDEALGQLRRSGARAEELARTGGSRGLLLARALQHTDKLLAELGLRDERADAWLAARTLAETPIRELEGVASVRVRGFSSWDNGELCLIEALHRKLRAASASGVVIELPAVNEALGPLLCAAVASVSAGLEARWASEPDHPELEFAEARSFSRPPRVVRAAHEASEARAVARTVLDALASGVALDRVAVVPVDVADAFLEPLRAELDRARLPFSEPWGRQTSAAPEAHAALELMRMAQGPVMRDALVDILRAPDLRLEPLSGPDPRQSHFVEILSRLPVRVDRSGKELLAALEARSAHTEPDDERTLEALSCAKRVLTALFARFERLRAKSTRRAFKEAWRGLFAELGLLAASRASLAQAIAGDERAGRAPLIALGQNASAGRAIDLALERLVEAADLLGLADEPLNFPDFLEEFASALSSVGANQGARRAGALRIARPTDVAGLDWDLLVVCRAASSTLDWQSSSSDGILDADLVEQLPRGSRPVSAVERALHTRFALASALSTARQAVFTWARRDARGSTGASRLVLNLAAEDTRDEPASPLDPSARRVLAPTLASAEVRARASGELRRQDFYGNPEQTLDLQNGLAGRLDAWVGGDAQRPIALTQLERYARCAFLGFSGIVLRAVRDEAVGDGLSARERGTLIHEALAVALSGTRARFGSGDLAQLESEALARAEAFLRAQTSSSLRGAALGAALEDVAALLRWSFANSDGIWFAEAERAFGSNAEWSSLPVGEHFVSGRIDRIDCNSDGTSIRIIDYKTGSVRLKGPYGEQLLQPWLYAKKVAEQYGAARVSSGYLSLQRRKPEWKAALPEGEPDSDAVQAKLIFTDELILALRAGRVPAKPRVLDSCTHCDARDICRRPLSAPHEVGE
jgi:ATP-dependent helicase/nuclease subunit B